VISELFPNRFRNFRNNFRINNAMEHTRKICFELKGKRVLRVKSGQKAGIAGNDTAKSTHCPQRPRKKPAKNFQH
jgi:hypothetical protein